MFRFRQGKELRGAASHGNEAKVLSLLAKGANVNAKDKYGWTPLHYASWNGHDAVAKLMLAKGANVNAKDDDEDTPLHYASQFGHADVAEVLLAKGADVDTKNKYGLTPLHWASRNGHVGVAEMLLAKGADVNAENKYGWTPLHWASKNDHAAVAEMLLAKGADVNAKDNDGRTPLHWASHIGHANEAEALLAKGADANARGHEVTPLHEASFDGHVGVAEMLLAKGADVNANRCDGSTPLHWASRNGHVSVAEILLAKGANVDAKDKDGKTALHWAREKGRDVIAQLLNAHVGSEILVEESNNEENFYTKVLQLDDISHRDINDFLGNTVTLIEDLHMLKLFYTIVSSLLRLAVLSKKEASRLINNGLDHSDKLCTCADSIAMYKVILKKAKKDAHVSDIDAYRYDNDAEVNRMEHAPFVRDIVASVQANTTRIEGLEANVESINDSVNKIRRGIKRKQKVEGVVGMFAATLNVISFGAAGSVFSAGMASVMENVVDFGDIVHLKEVVTSAEKEFMDEDLMEQVTDGVEMASGNYAESLLADAVREGHMLKVVSANASMAHQLMPVSNHAVGVSSVGALLHRAAINLDMGNHDTSHYEAKLKDNWFTEDHHLKEISVKDLSKFMPMRLAGEVHRLLEQEDLPDGGGGERADDADSMP